jgi:DNA-directed RNA polymerase specialized sigma24 family protein
MACDVHIDFSRRKTWKDPPSVVAKQEPDRAGDSTPEESIDVGSDVEDELSLLCAILSALPSERREVFRLYRVELLRDKQIVERTGLCLSTVRRHIKRSMGLYTRVEELLKSRKRAVETGA